MKIQVFKGYDELSEKTAEFIVGLVLQKPESLLCFPSGDSPTGTFQNLVQYKREGRVNFEGCKFVGLDEWVGMGRYDEGSCRKYIYENLFEPIKASLSQICYFEACADDLEQECRRIDSFVKENGPIDIMLVGLGMNGHIGLNEPGAPIDLYSHVVDISSTTKKVAQKYFKKKTSLNKGITLGLRHLMEAKTAILIASGEKKAKIVKQVVEGEVTQEVPAGILKRHNNSYIFLDEGAASMLECFKKQIGNGRQPCI